MSITQTPEITRIARPSLTCVVAYPFGLTLGAVGDDAAHRAVLDAVLRTATEDHPAGSVIDLGFRWTRDDLRERQLRKER
ncbi:MAG TPA: hypothetical protein VLS28_01285 [Candidatus Sulfomarinibacteraceae bacterium]|nr:hypothetical protein [Candidatus Sulfomarinibacteraceae bacterium]